MFPNNSLLKGLPPWYDCLSTVVETWFLVPELKTGYLQGEEDFIHEWETTSIDVGLRTVFRTEPQQIYSLAKLFTT